MRLKDYIQGNRSGKEANRLEREAMNDPFLQEALEGFDAVAGEHVLIIERLEKKYTRPVHRTRSLYYWSVAASFLLLVGISAYFFLERTEKTTSTIAMNQPAEKEEIIPLESIVSQPVQINEQQQKTRSLQKTPAKISESENHREILKTDAEMDVVADIADVDEIVEIVEIAEVAEVVATKSLLISEQEIKPSGETQTVILKESNATHNEVAVVGYGTQRRQTETSAVSAVRKSDTDPPTTFGEKEFQARCRQNADKNVCDGKGATVKLSFFIDETGKPSKIEYKDYSCEDAKKEIENLLSSSPVWTKKNRKVNMTVKW